MHQPAAVPPPGDAPLRLATQLLLIARNPDTGRLRRPGNLDIGLRAALLADLALQGRITEQVRGPVLAVPGETGDRILDAVARTVGSRPDVHWWRWFRHVRADREALVAELVQSGRWVRRSGGLRPAYDDTDAVASSALAYATLRVAEKRVAPADARQAFLASLTVMTGALTGRPRPRALKNDLIPLMDAVVRSREPGSELLPKVLSGAGVFSRRPLRR